MQALTTRRYCSLRQNSVSDDVVWESRTNVSTLQVQVAGRVDVAGVNVDEGGQTSQTLSEAK